MNQIKHMILATVLTMITMCTTNAGLVSGPNGNLTISQIINSGGVTTNSPSYANAVTNGAGNGGLSSSLFVRTNESGVVSLTNNLNRFGGSFIGTIINSQGRAWNWIDGMGNSITTGTNNSQAKPAMFLNTGDFGAGCSITMDALNAGNMQLIAGLSQIQMEDNGVMHFESSMGALMELTTEMVLACSVRISGGGTFIGNGAGLTNLNAAYLTGLTTNNLTVINTNFVQGQLYTNNYGCPIILMGERAKMAVTTTSGNSVLGLAIDNVTNVMSSEPDGLGILSGSKTNSVSSMTVSNLSTYRFVDLSSGAGNSSAIVGGQIVFVQQTTIAPAQNYKVYRALLTQSGTAAPVATVLENSLGAVPVWSYDSTGKYILTLSGAFPVGKTFVVGAVDSSSSFDDGLQGGYVALLVGNGNFVQANSVAGDGTMFNAPIEILIYP